MVSWFTSASHKPSFLYSDTILIHREVDSEGHSCAIVITTDKSILQNKKIKAQTRGSFVQVRTSSKS